MSEKPQTLKGFRDFLPKDMAIRNRVKKILTDVFESYGFEPIETPALEYAELLLGKYGPEADKLVYTFEDRGERKVGLRYDLTVPTARVAATHLQDLPTPFKRYQIQRVWRAENPQKGRYREFDQCDIDILGSSSPIADAEILAVIYSALSRLNIGNFQILINSRPMLYGIMEKAGIPENKYNDAAISIDKLDKMSVDEVQNELIEKRGIEREQVGKLFGIVAALESAFPNAEVLVESSEIPAEAPAEAFSSLKEIIKMAVEMGVDPKVLIPRFTLARGLDYYTGVIFETVVTEPKIGSLTGGGRYDNLIATLGGPDTPAVGTTIGLDRICDVISELGLWNDIPTTPAQVLITVFSPDLLDESIKYAKLQRESGVKSEVYIESDAKLEKQLKYADKKGIPWVVIMGPEEKEKGTIKLKNMKAGTEEEMPYHDLAAKLR